ncbi:MAG: hypothetical protein A2045_14065 [Rhodocyclales bacterium GWA2_65_20]|nr:MAG: hypothetical protein A2045_14065 [Rhodocyclales bacterium GWA2_65_20]
MWYRIVQTHLETWLELAGGEDGESPPAHVERTFRQYLESGIRALGFARAKGLPERVVLFRHALRNALIPILTGVVVVIPTLFMGSLLTESFFGIPGLGSYTIDAINAQDFAAVRSVVFIGSVLYIVGLLDSLHYRARLDAQPGAHSGTAVRYAVEVNSVLDALLSGLRQCAEKTYSAPLATHLYAKEVLANSTQREFPRLKHGGVHLGDKLTGHEFDIAARMSRGLPVVWCSGCCWRRRGVGCVASRSWKCCESALRGRRFARCR